MRHGSAYLREMLARVLQDEYLVMKALASLKKLGQISAHFLSVLISCISACSKCEYCRRGMYSHCKDGGWNLGNTIDGTQAEYVRIPYADTSLYKIPNLTDDAFVMLSDILPTGFECGVLNGKIQQDC